MSSQETIEIPAEVIGDYIAWEELQAFEHDEFEKELQQNVNKKQNYEMVGATVKQVSRRRRKSKENLRIAIPRPSTAIIIEDTDATFSKTQSPASSTESHRGIFNRAKERTRDHKQRTVTITRPGTQSKSSLEDLEEYSSERTLYRSFSDSHGMLDICFDG